MKLISDSHKVGLWKKLNLLAVGNQQVNMSSDENFAEVKEITAHSDLSGIGVSDEVSATEARYPDIKHKEYQ